MIPSIETIVEDLLAGSITKQQAVTWLNIHAENAYADLRDAFAMQCLPMQVSFSGDNGHAECVANVAYKYADAMLAARVK
jgi:hypothetical protein